jgi:hypothetical protein
MRSWVSGLFITLAGCSSGNVAPDAGGSVDGAPRFDAAQGDALLSPDAGQVEVDAGATQDAAPDAGDAAAQVDAGGDAQPGCRSGWCWESPRPTGSGVWSGSGVGSQDGWLVGELGVAFRWDGRAWSLVDTATTSDVLDVHAVSSTLAFAATPSQLIRWNGSVWTPEPGTRGLGLRALWASGSGDVWAVGPGRVLRYDGVSWAVARSDANDWRIIEGRGPDDVWVASSSVVSRWDGAGWTDHAIANVRSADARVDVRPLLGDVNPDRADAVVDALSSNLLGRSPSANTRKVLLAQAAPSLNGETAVPEIPKMLALLLGSPEFQRR